MDRETFLRSASTFKTAQVDIEGIGPVTVREVSAADAQETRRRSNAADADELANAAWLATRVVYDAPDGRPLLSDADIPQLMQLPIRVLRAIGDAAAELAEGAKKNATTT